MILLLKNLLFTAVAPGTVAVLVPFLIAGEGAAVTGFPRVIATGLFLLGAVIYAWCVWDFASYGRGTPAPIDAPKKLVARGLYRYTRNPMYLGVLTFTLGWAVLFETPVIIGYAILVFAGFHAFVRLYEEPHLERTFGADYARYKGEVSRWISIPQRRSDD